MLAFQNPEFKLLAEYKTGEDFGAQGGSKSARMAKLWQFLQGHPKPVFSVKVQRGDQGKFFKNRQKSSPCLKGPKALWRKLNYTLIKMYLKCKDWRRFWREQRLQKCPNDLAITWPFGHFWSRLMRQNLVQCLHFKCVQITGWWHFRQSALGPLKRGVLSGRFFKSFSWSHLCFFSENAGFGWPSENCHNLAIRAPLEALLAPKSFPVFAF